MMDQVEFIVLITGGVLYVFNEVRKELRSKSTRKRKQTVEDGMEVNEKIYPILWRMLAEFRATRVFIIQFHNGEVFYTGQSIQRNTISHEVTLKGVDHLKHTIDNQMISNVMHQIIRLVGDSGEYAITNIIQEDLGMATDEFVEKCDANNVKSIHYFRITDKSYHTVGMLVVTWNHREELSKDEIFGVQNEVKKLENILER